MIEKFLHEPDDLPFPEVKEPAVRDDDTTSPDGENDNDSGTDAFAEAAHNATKRAMKATKAAGKADSADKWNDAAVAHSLAVSAHAKTADCMDDDDRPHEAGFHKAMAVNHEHQECKARLAAKNR